jgi:hypothetical protein
MGRGAKREIPLTMAVFTDNEMLTIKKQRSQDIHHITGCVKTYPAMWLRYARK